MVRKIARMHALFGIDRCHKCGECSNFVSGRYMSKILRKCRVYGLTHSQASDWAKSWAACGMFNREYAGRNVIELTARDISEEPMDGQIDLFAKEESCDGLQVDD